MYLSVCINQMLPEKFSCMLVDFYLLCFHLYYDPILWAQIQNGEICISGKYRGKREEPWGSFSLELLHADLRCRWLGPSIWSLFFLQRTDGKHLLPGKRVLKPLDYTACSFCRSALLGRLENSFWDRAGGRSMAPSDSFSSLDFWIRTWQIQQVPSLSLRQGRVAAKTGKCILFLWFPWMLDIARYCCRGQSILVWQSNRKTVT